MSTSREPVIVVGNGVAGHSCAVRLAELGSDVTLVGPGLPHDRPPLSKRALATGTLPLLSDAQKLAARGVRQLDGLVADLDLDARRLTVEPAAGGGPVTLDAPLLVWATGLRYPRPPVPGIEAAGENATGAGMLALARQLERPGRRVVVIGAGLIGTETAATLAERHDVTLVDMLERPLARFLPLIADAAVATLAELGVRFLGGCAIAQIDRAPAGLVVRTSSHGDLDCDVLVSAAGFRTSLPACLAGDDPRALAMAADETLRVEGREGLWACGDCVTFPHPRFGRIGIPHWDHAHYSGRHVAEAIHGSGEPYVRDPYFFSDIGPLRIQQLGLADRAASWRDDDGLAVGLADDGRPVCVVLLNAPRRLREARALMAV
jgi:3-phenylpropionate/trans-cinnamate dioxygenase ferredoxin reductase subunit